MGEPKELSEEQTHLGLLLEQDALYGEYLDEYTAKLARAVSGMEMAKERDEAELSRLRALKAAFARKREEWNG